MYSLYATQLFRIYLIFSTAVPICIQEKQDMTDVVSLEQLFLYRHYDLTSKQAIKHDTICQHATSKSI